MRYSIDVLDGAMTRVAELTGLVSASLFERVNAVPRLTVTTAAVKKWAYIAPGKSFLRLRGPDGNPAGTFRIMETTIARERERPALTVVAKGLLGDLAGEIFPDEADCNWYTPAELLALALRTAPFLPGTVEPQSRVPFVRFDYEPILDCLLRICSLTGGELSLDEETGRVSLLNRTGADNGAVFRYGFNLRSVSRTVDLSRLANRVYGVGGGSPALTIQDAYYGGESMYVEDYDSMDRWGPREGLFREPTLESVTNVVENPILDGEYTDGLCEGWTNLGATVSRNGDASYRLYGRYSQKVRTGGAGQGISRTVMVVPGMVYSFFANIFVAAGAVRVKVEDGTAVYRRTNPVTGGGFVTVRIEGWKAITSSVTVKIVQEGTAAADFFVDSIQIAAGTRVLPFSVGNTADALLYRTYDFLDVRKEPEITYRVDLTDRAGLADRAGGSGVSGRDRAASEFGLGDTVTVVDPPLGLRVSTRVMERETDLLHPSKVSVRLDNPARKLNDVITALREAQDAGIRHTRAVLTEASTAAEAGSSRLGFSAQTLRFSGRITASGWNGVAWSAGTLRVGYAWFTLAAGSVSGLAENTAYSFYFDRTAPSGFGHTTDPSAAEGEDRIPVFSLTTTVSPSPAVVHALGIITG